MPKELKLSVQLTKEQKEAVKTIVDNTVTSVRGIAGTGKSTTVFSYALREMMKDKTVQLYVAKPPVEAIFNLGFLPGSIEDKVRVYHEIIFKIIRDLFIGDNKDKNGKEGQLEKLKERIHIYDISFLRGITFPVNSIVVLEEAQNMPIKGLELLIGRLSHYSKIVLVGDENQQDVKHSGFMQYVEVSREILGAGDVVLNENHRDPIALSIVKELTKRKY